MAGFLLRRLAGYLALGVLATFLAYAAAAATFNPLERFATRSPPPPPEVVEDLRRDLLLDEPIPMRFLSWAAGVVQGDFGQTITGQPVADELWSRVGVSLRLFLIGTTTRRVPPSSPGSRAGPARPCSTGWRTSSCPRSRSR